jgi:hypothetical protein
VGSDKSGAGLGGDDDNDYAADEPGSGVSEEETDWEELTPMTAEEAYGGDAVCIFCAFRADEPAQVFAHMAKDHGFDFAAVVRERRMGFYSRVKLINYLRKRVMDRQCPMCAEQLSSSELLAEHMRDQGHCGVGRDDTAFVKLAEYFFPTLENDPLLQSVHSVLRDKHGEVVDDEVEEREEEEEDRMYQVFAADR